MSANPRTYFALCLTVALSLVLLAQGAAAQRRRSQRPTRTKPAAKPAERGKRAVIRWAGQPGVERYRLQVASDREFSDIIYDRAVVGLEAIVELPVGDNFFWRVAPAPQNTGEYSAVEPVTEFKGAGRSGGVMNSKAAKKSAPADVGWQTLTGEVLRPQPAHLRAANAPDVVAVNADGTVFALDGTNGSTLWTARFSPDARRDEATARPASVFTPVVVRAGASEKVNIVVAFDGGVRALEGETGRELWRMALPGAALGGVVADLDNDQLAAELTIVTDAPAVHFIEARSGRAIAQEKLDGALVGTPIPFITGTTRGVALTLAGGMIDVRRLDGSRFRAVKFDLPFTTPPLVFTGPNGTVIVVGTERGLLFLNGDDLKPLGKITTPGDNPRGRLGVADLDRDNALEIVAVMKSGKVIAVSGSGRVLWSAAGAGDAYAPTFADLNGDGTTDVLVASERAFALGFDGRDGALLWQVGEPQGASVGGAQAALRSLAIIAAGSGRTLVVSGDQKRAGLRAVGLPTASVKVAAQ